MVELDTEKMPSVLQKMFSTNEMGACVMITGRKIPLIEEFDPYVVDYFGRLWPFGEYPESNPLFISNMMIKRVVSYGFRNEEEEHFALEVKTSQLENRQISTSFMPSAEVIRFYESLNEKGNEDGISD